MCVILIYSDFIDSLTRMSQVPFILYNTLKIKDGPKLCALQKYFKKICKIQHLMFTKAANVIKLNCKKMFSAKIKV